VHKKERLCTFEKRAKPSFWENERKDLFSADYEQFSKKYKFMKKVFDLNVGLCYTFIQDKP